MIDMTTVLMEPDGVTPIKDGDPKSNKPLTLGALCSIALSDPRGQESMSGKDKYEMGLLARKLAWSPRAGDTEGNDPVASLIAEEIVLLKERIGLLYVAPVVVTAWDLLENKTPPTKAPP